MSDPRYQPGIIRGIAQYARLTYGPDEVPGLGRMSVGAFTRCVDCPPDAHPSIAGTFTRYGMTPLCRTDARARVLEAKVAAALGPQESRA